MVQILVFLFAFQSAQSQEKKQIYTGQQITITYGSISWNNDSRAIDTAFLVVRDKTSGKIATIQLEETEPDSSSFRGKFSLTFADAAGVAPEVYVPPANMRKETDVTRLYSLIQGGQLQRKPVISRKTDKGPFLDVYDTKDQAEQALKAYQAEQLAAKQRLIKPMASNQNMDAAKIAQMNALASEAAKREAERIRLAQIERQRMLEQQRITQALSEKQKEMNRKMARQLADQAFKHYQAGEFIPAEEKFRKAAELDPGNDDYHYKHGLSLYRVNKFNEALVALNLVKDDPKINLEKKYFIALIHLRLKEYQQALPPLLEIGESKDPMLGPSALFYQGVVLFEMERFEEAKKPFETVIDTSQDPALDQAAEDYLDRIAGAIAMKQLREKKFTLTATAGGMYDTNVVLSQDADSLSNFGTDEADFKLMLVGDLEFRALYTEKHELAAVGAVNFSQASKTELQYTDPWIYTLTAPYSYKSVAWGKGYKMTAKPGYEILNMGEAEGDTSKKEIQTSMFLNVDNTFIMRKDWFSTYTVEYRLDDSKLSSSIGASDSDATKISLKTAQSFFLDGSRKEAIVGSAGLVMNDAKGDEKRYQRYELGVLYVRPVLDEASMNVGLNYYMANYSKSTDSRKDTDVALNAGLNKAWSEKVTLGALGIYTVNSSNVATNEYNKFMFMTTATFKTNF